MEQITLRDYQDATIAALFDYFSQNQGSPIVALPTGTGKSIIIGEFTRIALTQYPTTRVLGLTHVKELIEQNLNNLLKIWPTAPADVYSAGIGRKNPNAPIVFAGIQSAYKNAKAFGHFDLVLIDECHLVSTKGTTMYRTFLDEMLKINPKLKVIGFSATPYRLGQGMLTDADKGLFTDVAFDLTGREAFNWLIAQGHLAPLIPKRTQNQLDVSAVPIQGGEYVQRELQHHVDKEEITMAALGEAVQLAGERHHWLVFASGIEHSEHIAEYLEVRYGIQASYVHSRLSKGERDARLKAFRSGEIQAMVNNNILTTGFDYPDIDCIVMLRPTASPGLWVQMLGRGTRPAPGKQNCLVLDFAGNTQRLGPINDPVLPRKKGKGPKGMAPVRLCEHCGCYSHASCRVCQNPDCGLPFPQNVKISSAASFQELIVGDVPPLTHHQVQKVVYRLHKKDGKPASMRVDYYCGLRQFSDFICLDHGGYASRVARQWWELRCPWGVPPSVEDGMKAVDYLSIPTRISVIEKKRFPEIVGYEF